MKLLAETWQLFRSRNAPLLSGAVAFYVTLALAPLGVIALALTGFVFGIEKAQYELIEQLRYNLGDDLAQFIAYTISNSTPTGSTWVATAFTLVLVLFLTTRLFVMLRRALNHVWGVHVTIGKRSSDEWFRLLRKRLIAFAMVFVCGAALVLLVVVRTASNVAASMVTRVPYIEHVAQFVISMLLVTVFVSLVFRWLSDAAVTSKDAWLGGLLTSFLMTLGSFLIGAYLAFAGLGSAYGAAGSLIVLLLWIYYSSQIFFLGATFTRVWAKHNGRPIQPLPHATFDTIGQTSFSEELSE